MPKSERLNVPRAENPAELNLVEWVLTDFVYDNVERNRLGHAMQGELPCYRPGVIVLLHKIGADKRHLGKLGDVEPIGAFKILVTRCELRLQAVSLDRHVQFAGRNIIGIEADVATEVAK